MSLRNSQPTPFVPSGVTDAVDGTNAPAGSMSALVNLIPDPSTNNIFTCRSAATLLTDFPGFSSPGFVSVFHVVGSLIYGMIGTSLVPGRDQPFCYDANAGAFITVTGAQTAATLPLSPSQTGIWVPPTMDFIGSQIIVTHPGFPGGAGAYFGWFDVTNPAAPVWNAGNTAGHALLSVPVAVAQFSGRAWYAVGNALVFSDALAATVVTNASQVLIVDTNEPFTALAGMPLNSPVTAGIIEALLAFKGVSAIFQVTGDATTANLSLNALNVATGTLAPNSIVPTPMGVAFVSPQGLRFIDFTMAITNPVGAAGTGVVLPFLYTVEPSRICAAYNADTVRISSQNGKAPGSPWQEWWYDTARDSWTGPHTFPASFIHSFTHPTSGAHQSFVMAPQGVTGKLFDSHSFPSSLASYVENGAVMSFQYTTSMLPDTYQMSESNITEQTINMALPGGTTVAVTAQDPEQVVLTSSLVNNASTTIWGAFVWGVGIWRGASGRYRPWQIQWPKGVTFRMLSVKFTGSSAADFQIGTLYTRFDTLGYLQQESP